MAKSKVKEAIEKEKTKEGLPKEAFAIVGDPRIPRPGSSPTTPKPSSGLSVVAGLVPA